MTTYLASAPVVLQSMQSIIDILQDYATAASQLGIRHRGSRRVRDLILALRVERSVLIDIVTHVFGHQSNDMIEGRTAPTDEQLQNKIKAALGPSLRPIHTLLQQLLGIVRELAGLLNLDDSDQEPWKKLTDNRRGTGRCPTDALAQNDTDNRFSEAFMIRYEGFKLAWRNQGLNEYQYKINSVNEKLQWHVERAKQTSKSKLQKDQLRRLDKCHRQAFVLSRVFGSQQGFDCSCRDKHLVLLRLENTLPRNVDTLCFSQTPVFKVILHNPSMPRGATRLLGRNRRFWQWAELDTWMKDKKQLRLTPFQGDSSDSEDSFDLPKTSTIRDKITRFQETILWPLSTPPPPGIKSSLNLCIAALEVQYAQDGIIGMLGTKDTGSLQVRVQKPKVESCPWTSVLSLRNIIEDPAISLTAFPTESRLRLALTMATSVLHLYETSWIHRSWTGNDIHFIRSQNGLVLTEAFVSQSSFSPDGGIFPGEIAPSILEPTIFALGKLLTELSLDHTWDDIRQYYTRKSMPECNSILILDMAVVNSILDNASNENLPIADRPFHAEGSYYLEAVRTCLTCDLGEKFFLDKDGMRQIIYQRIICPLQFAMEDNGNMLHTHPDLAEMDIEECQFGMFDDREARPEAMALAEEWFDLFRENVFPLLPRRSLTPIRGLVKVAILDTGIDRNDAFIKRNSYRIKYRNFVVDDDDACPTDTNGHGTFCTALLLQIAENADIYHARVTASNSLESPESIVEAMQWVIREGVDIISLSFGFHRRSVSLEGIQNCILSAYKEGIVILAAASNDGGNRGIAYPADQNEVICIGSSDGKGNKSPFTPGPYPYTKNFSTLGEGVTSSWPSSLSSNGRGRTKVMSGTSVATPVASGVVAVIIDYLRHLPAGVDENLEFLLSQLRSKKGVEAVLLKVSE
ncbi:hypothetical protein MW887_001844 [Aspergillus wentii]|nr:hypothetical protein MW887_001844 [Aspergillus wentii]